MVAADSAAGGASAATEQDDFDAETGMEEACRYCRGLHKLARNHLLYAAVALPLHVVHVGSEHKASL